MSVKKAAIDATTVEPVSQTGYPEPYRSQVMPREKRRLGDVFGLTKIGINRTTLAPGKVSSMCHWHTAEDEFIYMLEGEVVLRTTSGEQLISAGMCVGFPAGVEEGHQLINRGAHPARSTSRSVIVTTKTQLITRMRKSISSRTRPTPGGG
jgi:uncharacterized cupin superfamily protein